jgi:hypothetical protein
MAQQQLKRRDAVLIEPPVLQAIGPLPPEQIFFGASRSEQAFGGPTGVLQALPSPLLSLIVSAS